MAEFALWIRLLVRRWRCDECRCELDIPWELPGGRILCTRCCADDTRRELGSVAEMKIADETTIATNAVCWETENPFTGAVAAHDSQEAAAEWAVQNNRADDRRPSCRLYRRVGRDRVYVGRLHRKFGEDFDLESCWM